MSATSSHITPLMLQNGGFYGDVTDPARMGPAESVSHVQYPLTTRVRYSYRRPARPRYRYKVEQEDQSYRCCQWCQQWCTRRCPLFDFCDRIVSCPLLFYIFSGVLLLLLFAGLVTLFSLHPSVNSSRRFYGVISTISILNRTKYIFGLDALCNRIGTLQHCLELPTSTSISLVTTTITVNEASSTTSWTILLFCSLSFSLISRVCNRT